MATWKTYRISDAVRDINEGKFVLPVIQRYLVWDEEKMELLFDTLLKGDSFGGIMVIEEEKGENLCSLLEVLPMMELKRSQVK
jgi:uncharacterized protein with ParB-like and HNH nuclease domain